MKRIILISFFIIYNVICCFSQNNLCSGADPFCTGSTYNFPAGVNMPGAETGPDYGCLYSQPNPVWYYLLIDQPGNFIIEIHSVPQHDLDFICWGPFNTFSGMCNNLDSVNIIDCDYTPSYQSLCNITNAQTGDYYVFLITNYSNQSCNIVFHQDSLGQPGNGSTNCCKCLCTFDDISLNIDSCNNSGNFFVSGQMFFNLYFTISTGQLMIVDQPSGMSQVFNAPFSSLISPLSYHLLNIPADGLQHSLTATFTDAPTCTYTILYQAPDSCMTSGRNDLDVFTSDFIELFPNPAKDFVKLKIKEYTGDVKITITNIYRQEKLKTIIPSSKGNEIFIPLNNFTAGVYLLTIEIKSELRTLKFTVQ